MLLLPTPVRQTAYGNSPELCGRPRPVPQIMIFVFPAFTLSPFSSIASFQVKSLLKFFDDSAMISRSSAQRSSQGTPERNSRDKASNTMMKSRGWVPSLGEHPSSLQTLHCTLTNTDTAPRIDTHPLHQSHNPLLHTKFSQRPSDDLPRHSIKRLPQVYKCHVVPLLAARYFSCSCLTTKIASVVPAWDEAKLGIVDWHKMSDEAVHNPLQDFHDLLC